MSNQPSVHAAKLVEIVSAAQNETKSAVAEMKAAVQQRDSALTAAKDAKTELRKIQSQELQVKSHLDAAKEIIDMKEKDLVALREKHAKTVKAVRAEKGGGDQGAINSVALQSLGHRLPSPKPPTSHSNPPSIYAPTFRAVSYSTKKRRWSR